MDFQIAETRNAYIRILTFFPEKWQNYLVKEPKFIRDVLTTLTTTKDLLDKSSPKYYQIPSMT